MRCQTRDSIARKASRGRKGCRALLIDAFECMVRVVKASLAFTLFVSFVDRRDLAKRLPMMKVAKGVRMRRLVQGIEHAMY